METNDTPFHWDPETRIFAPTTRCPYPDCAQPVDPVLLGHVMRWCPNCSRPFESLMLGVSGGSQAVEVTRRPATGFCSLTGKPITDYSMLDWGEAGGGPGAANCLNDPLGSLFGEPDPDYSVALEAIWECDSICGARHDLHDEVSSVSVVRGRVVAVSRRGRIAVLDPESGALLTENPLEWPTASIVPYDMERSVMHQPAFRGTIGMIATPHEATIQDLKPHILGLKSNILSRHLLHPTADNRRFFGPPTAVDGDPPLFCLWEGCSDSYLSERDDSCLRFFSHDGRELGRCGAPDIARRPIFDPASRHLLWVDRYGIIYALPANGCCNEQEAKAREYPPNRMLKLPSSVRTTFALCPDSYDRPELWLAGKIEGKGIAVYRTGLDTVLREDLFEWDEFLIGDLGQVMGLAVGIGSRHRANAAGNMLAVSTDMKIVSFPKNMADATPKAVLEGVEGRGVRGSLDPPLICSAGVIARTASYLHLDSHGYDWSRTRLLSQSPLFSNYQNGQGIAPFGRRVFLGSGLGVKGYEIKLVAGR